MLDIKLTKEGDIDVSDIGDISLTQSVIQTVKIRLKWIYEEWRLGPEFGFRWFENVFVKNPNTESIREMIREQILDVDEVTDAVVTLIEYDRARRIARFKFVCEVGEEIYRDEVTLYG